jgi:hypothetical protein
LKTKFAGIDEKVLDRIATKAAKTVKSEEEAKTYVEDTTLQQVIDSYTDSRVTEAQESAIKGYEKKHNLLNGKPVKAEDTDPDPEDDPEDPGKKDPGKKDPGENTPSYVKELMKGIESLGARMDAFENGRTKNTRKSQFEALFKDASDELKERYSKQFNRMSFKDDDDFASYLDEVKADVENDITVEKGKVGGPKASQRLNPDTVSQYLKARVEARKAEQAAPAISGLPTK